MDNEIDKLLEVISLDYALSRARGDYGSDTDLDDFRATLSVEEGRKYLKVVRTDNQTTVWGFIVKEDDKKFKKGDILKAASWAAPARNKARGNILDDDYSVRWTGPHYL